MPYTYRCSVVLEDAQRWLPSPGIALEDLGTAESFQIETVGNHQHVSFKLKASSRGRARIRATGRSALFARLLALDGIGLQPVPHSLECAGDEDPTKERSARAFAAVSRDWPHYMDRLRGRWTLLAGKKAPPELLLTLEWTHIAISSTDRRSQFLAYWTALEILVEVAAGTDEGAKLLEHETNGPEELKKLRSALSAVLDLCLRRAARERVMNYLLNAKAESDIDRWVRVLGTNGIEVYTEEMKDLRSVRGSVVHSGSAQVESETVERVKELVRQMFDAMLSAPQVVGEGA